MHVRLIRSLVIFASFLISFVSTRNVDPWLDKGFYSPQFVSTSNIVIVHMVPVGLSSVYYIFPNWMMVVSIRDSCCMLFG